MLNKLNYRNKTLFLILLLLFQITVLAVMVLNSYLIILWGEQITLKVEPVDPHSLFQGDYVRLDYAISRLDLSKVEHDFDPMLVRPQDRIYLALIQDGDTCAPQFLTLDPSLVRDKIYLQGKVQYLYQAPVSLSPVETRLRTEKTKTEYFWQLNTSWGIEQYFIPEGTGKEIEEQITKGNIYAKIAVYKGKARVTGLVNK